MALPTSFEPAVRAVYEHLCDVVTTPRALTSDRLFLRLAARRADADIAAQAIAQKRVMVVLRDLTVVPGPEMQPSNRLRYAGLIEVVRVYHAGNDLMSEEMERARLLAADDLHHVRAALTYPGALTLTADGSETGIDGGALNATGHRSTGPTPTAHALTWVDLYPITISLEAST